MRRLASLLPATIAGPPRPPFIAPAFESRRSCDFGVAPLWQPKHEASRIGFTSRTKSTGVSRFSIHDLRRAILSADRGATAGGIRNARSDVTTRWNSGLAGALPGTTAGPDVPPLAMLASESSLKSPAGCAPL